MNTLRENTESLLPTADALTGCLLGGAVGDALGLPSEGLSRSRQRRLFGEIDRHRFFLGRGMVSDDTEHAIMTAQALIASGGDTARFRKDLAARLRRWFLCLPAGVGLATLRACLKLLVGVPPDRSGVRSAGNGPAMRAAIIGVYCREKSLETMAELVRASTRLTHSDERAEVGALAIALAAKSFGNGETAPLLYRNRLGHLLPGFIGTSTTMMMEYALASAEGGEETVDFAATLVPSDRVTGFIDHTVPVCLHAAFRYPDDFRAAILAVIACGGDTDTTAAIVGGIVGAYVGKAGIPAEWLSDLADWPCDVAWMERVGGSLELSAAGGTPSRPPTVPLPLVLLRNLLFLLVVLYHGFRRLLPPW